MKRGVWIMVLLLVTGSMRAQERRIELSLQSALDIALDENPTIRIAGLEIERQNYVRKETLGNHLPQLSATGVYNYAAKKSTIDIGGGQKFSFEPDNTVSVTGQLAIPLFAPAIYSTLKLNDEQMRLAVESARSSKITLVSEVKKAYYNILLAQKSLRVLLASRDNVRQTVDQTQTLYSQELASEYDLLTAQVQLSNLQPTIIQTRNSIDMAKRMLKMYLFLPENVEVELTGTLDDMYRESLENRLDLYATDLSNNTDIRRLDIQESILNRQLKVSRTNRMPTVSFVGSAQYLGRNKISFGAMMGGGDGTTLPTASWENQFPVSLGVQMSIPIFAGTTNIQRDRQIRNGIEQVKLQRDYLAESVKVQSKSAVDNILTAQAQMEANKTTIDQARRGYEISKTRYLAGMGTILELNSTELSLTQAQLNYSQSVYDYLAAEAEYAKILGNER